MIRKVWAMSSAELRLLLRAKSRLAGRVALPIAGAAFFGFIGRASASSVASLGLFPILAMSAVLLATGPSVPSMLRDILQSDYAPDQATMMSSWAVSSAVVLLGQSVLYDLLVTIISPSSGPGVVRTLSGILIALLLGLIVLRVSKRR